MDKMDKMDEEINFKLYDRQIRLWGIDAQKRMAKARVLVYSLNGLNAEICKNLVLSGVGNVHIMDHEKVTSPLLSTNFFVNESQIGQNRAKASCASIQELNPLVKVTVSETHISQVPQDFYNNFDIVIVSHLDLSTQVKVNDICRSKGIMFISVDTFGTLAIMFQDLTTFDYKTKNTNVDSKEILSKSIEYCPLKTIHNSKAWNTIPRLTTTWLGIQLLYHYQALNGHLPSDETHLVEFKNEFLKSKLFDVNFVSDDFCKTLARIATAELSFICAIVGGVFAQEVIKIISRDADPIDNYFVYDGIDTFSGFVEKIKF